MTALADRLRSIEDIVGQPHVLTATEAVSQHRVDGKQPLAVVFPGRPEEVTAVLRQASESGLSVLLRGGGRHMHLGSTPGPIGLLVSLGRLDQIIDFDHENLTITAQAGVTLEALQRRAAERGQMLPLDPPGGDGATIGAIAATNLSGPLRMRYGAPRDLVIGLRVALADGTLVKAGGKTVKNVAGYELTKFLVGSFGTLAAMCEVTVRLTPLPEAKVMVLAALPPPRAREVARQLLTSRLEIASLAICSPAALARMRLPVRVNIDPDMQIVFAGLMGDTAAVGRQQRELAQMAGSDSVVLAQERAEQAWRAVREAVYPQHPNEVILRAAAPISETAGLLQLAASWDGWWAIARMGDGIIYAGTSAVEGSAERLRELRGAAEAAGGYAVLEVGAPEVKRSFGVWGEAANIDLMRRLKESYDPRGILGCGRYLPGL